MLIVADNEPALLAQALAALLGDPTRLADMRMAAASTRLSRPSWRDTALIVGSALQAMMNGSL